MTQFSTSKKTLIIPLATRYNTIIDTIKINNTNVKSKTNTTMMLLMYDFSIHRILHTWTCRLCSLSRCGPLERSLLMWRSVLAIVQLRDSQHFSRLTYAGQCASKLCPCSTQRGTSNHYNIVRPLGSHELAACISVLWHTALCEQKRANVGVMSC